MNLKEMLSGKVRVGLKEIKYTFIGSKCEESRIDYHDEVKLGEITREYLEVLVTRKVYFKPEDIFNLEITYYVLHRLNEDIEEDVDKLSKDEIYKEIMSDIEYYTEEEQAKVAQLIAEITGAFTMNPLITPPVFMEKEVLQNENISDN